MTSEVKHTPWEATNEALLINTDHIQQWNMAVVGPEGKTPIGLVAMVWGSSPEGVQRRANVIAAAPSLLEALEFLANVARMMPGISAMALKQADEAVRLAREGE